MAWQSEFQPNRIYEELDLQDLVGLEELEMEKKDKMNNATNTGLSVVATGLIAVGVNTITTNLWAGVVEVVLGIVVYAVYEFTPTTK